ncbi:radical SAM protein [Fusobacterium nucleatum]|uniref:B12-binding domain-containing radical SAM protein n=1 Tax=Fusobacterium nucleatum TaxID=851 RepID=UPI0030CB987B
MKNLIIFPPGWHPSGPYLALPILKSFLEANNIKIDTDDINIKFFNEILSKKFVISCIEKLKIQSRSNIKIDLIKESCFKIDEAIFLLKSSKFFEEKIRNFVINTISNTLELIKYTFFAKELSFQNIELCFDKTSSEEIKKNIDNTNYNLYLEFLENYVLKNIVKENYDFVAISISGSSQFIPALTIAKLIKKHCSSVKHISFGGNYITRIALENDKSLLFLFDFINSIMLYDGEISILNLINKLERNENLDSVNNLIYFDLETLNIQRNEIIETDYINELCPNFDDFILKDYLTPEVALPIYSSRSCFSICSFCTIPKATSGKYRKCSIKNIFLNMVELNSKYGINIFCFVDETLDIKNMLTLSKMLIKNKKSFYWYGETRFSPMITDKASKILYKGGCRQIQLGLESYNQRVLNKMQKNIDLKWIEKNIEALHKNHIATHLFFFTGFPTETKIEAMNTYKFTKNVIKDAHNKYNVNSTYGFTSFGLEKGSDVYINPQKYNIKVEVLNFQKYDLKLNRNYTSIIGLSQIEADKMVKEEMGIFKFRENRRIKIPSSIIISEKISILDSIYKKDNFKNSYKIFNETKILTLEDTHFSLSNDTYYIFKGNCIIFYNLIEKNVIKVKKDFISVRGNNIIINKNFKNIIKKLIFYNIVDNENYFIISNSSCMKKYKLKLVRNLSTKLIDNSYFLFNSYSNTLIKLNRLSYLIIKLFKNPIYLKDLEMLINTNKINLKMDNINELIKTAVENKILELVC